MREKGFVWPLVLVVIALVASVSIFFLFKQAKRAVPEQGSQSLPTEQLPRASSRNIENKILFLKRVGDRFTKHGIWTINADDGNVAKIFEVDSPPTVSLYTPRWSPNGEKIAFVRDLGLWVVNNDGSNAKKLFSPEKLEIYKVSGWSPAGTKIAFSENKNAYIISASDGILIDKFTPETGVLQSVKWASNRFLLFNIQTITQKSIPIDPKSIKQETWLWDLDTKEKSKLLDFFISDTSSDGEVVIFVRYSDDLSSSSIWITNLKGEKQTQILNSQDLCLANERSVIYQPLSQTDQIKLSPLADKIAFYHSCQDPTTGDSKEERIVIFDLEARKWSKIDLDPKMYREFDWSPDGQRIAILMRDPNNIKGNLEKSLSRILKIYKSDGRLEKQFNKIIEGDLSWSRK